MHLLNTVTLQLESFADNKIPDYVILSHRWGNEEVSYQEILEYGLARTTQTSEGSCKIALENGHKYMWVDTCCIDKTSSAKLSEAINSMYNWYFKAAVCYTYLSDVLGDDEAYLEEEDSRFADSRWFTRGWTLQELIASPKIIFYSRTWSEIGTKASLKMQLSKITGVDIEVLEGQDPRSMSVAKRMSWASQREIERKEDIAYCLMGLFDINMPLLYGEGEKAFIRLQEEILKSLDDHSIFAWNNTKESEQPCDLLAPSPAHFSKSGNVVPIDGNRDCSPFTMKNQGLLIELPMIKIPGAGWYLAPLNCHDCQHGLGPYVIVLGKAYSSFGRTHHQFIRINTPRYFLGERRLFFDLKVKNKLDKYAERRTVYILRGPTRFDNLHPYRAKGSVYKFQIQLASSFDYIPSLTIPESSWNEKTAMFSLEKSIGMVAGIAFCRRERKFCQWIALIVGVDRNFDISLQLYPMKEENEMLDIYRKYWILLRSPLTGETSEVAAFNALPVGLAVSTRNGIASKTIKVTVSQAVVNGEEIHLIHLDKL